MSDICYPAQMCYAYVILGPYGNAYYESGEQEPFLVTAADVPIIPRIDEPLEAEVKPLEVIVISDDEEDDNEVQPAVQALQLQLQPLPMRAAAMKCTALLKEFFTTLELYGEEF